LTKERLRRSSVSAKSRLIYTLSALASESSVPSEGEIAVLDLRQLPAERPAAAASSATVKIERLAQLAHLGADLRF
jgi:hypothetical protein